MSGRMNSLLIFGLVVVGAFAERSEGGVILSPEFDLRWQIGGATPFLTYTSADQSNSLTGSSPVSAARTYHEVNGPYSPGNQYANNSITFDGHAHAGDLGDSIDTSVGLPIQAQMTVSYRDYFTLASSTLPIGTPVDYEIIYALHAGIAGNGSGFAASNAGYLTSSGNASAAIHFAGVVGDTTQITDYLTVRASASGYLIDPNSFTETVNALNTAHTYLNILTPGVTYTTASGASYAAPTAVPEPSSALLVLTAAPALAWFARRRRDAQMSPNSVD